VIIISEFLYVFNDVAIPARASLVGMSVGQGVEVVGRAGWDSIDGEKV
jgi:hypothetical protein